MTAKVFTVLGTRPEIIKLSPVLPLLDGAFRHVLVHTGQHYDENMDRVFFRELKLKAPKFFLGAGTPKSGALTQLGFMLERLEPLLRKHAPDAVVVQGDTNSTLAGALAAARLGVPVFHIEAGCRSFNRAMPEEQNRVMVDHLADLLFAPDSSAVKHLRREGIRAGVHLVGNSGLDAARRTLSLASEKRLRRFGVTPEAYVLATVHRAENTDDAQRLSQLVAALSEVARHVPVIFPMHPRTASVLRRHKLRFATGVTLVPPVGSVDLLALLRYSIFAMSDSGGVQEEAAVVNKPCLILRDETEWTRLVEAGKNFLAGTESKKIVRLAVQLLNSKSLRQKIHERRAPLRFGASERILDVITRQLQPDRKARGVD